MKSSAELSEHLHFDLLQLEEINKPEFQFNFLWKFKAGDRISASPCVWKENVFINSSDGYIYSVNISTGEEIWKKKLVKDERDMAIDSAPAVSSEGNLFVSSFKYLYSIDIFNGAILAERDGFFNHSSIVLDDGKVFAGQKNYLCAYNQKNLEKIWEFSAHDYIEGTALVKDGIVYFGSEGAFVYALDSKDGKLIWEFNTGDGIEATPVICGDTLFIGSRDNTFYAINCHDGCKIWSVELDGEISSSAAFLNGAVYVTTVFGDIYAFNIETGCLIWKSDVVGTVYSSLVADRGAIYLNSSGRLKMFDVISAKTGQLLWCYNIDKDIYSSPVISDNKIFVTATDGCIYAFSRKNTSFYKEEPAEERVFSKKIQPLSSPVDKEKELKKKKRAELEEKLKARAKIKKDVPLEQAGEELQENKIGTAEKIVHSNEEYKLQEEVKTVITIHGKEHKISELEKKLKAKALEKAREYEEKFKALADKKNSECDKQEALNQETEADRADKFFNVAKTQLQKKMIDPAINSFKRALEIIPDNIDYLLALGEALKYKKDFKGASLCYEKAIKLQPDKKELKVILLNLYIETADFYVKEGAFDIAFDYITRAIEYGEDGEAYFILGDIYIVKEDIPRAINYFLKGLELKDSINSLIKVCDLYSHNENSFDEVFNILHSRGLVEQDSARAYFIKAILLEQEDWETSVRAYDNTIQLDSDFIYAYSRLGSLYLQGGKADMAEKMFRKSIDIDPSFSVGYCGLGQVMINYGKTSEAFELLKKAISLNPLCFEAYCFLARISMAQGKFEDARGYIGEIKGLYRMAPLFYIVSGELFIREKKWHEAFEFIKKAMDSFYSTWDTLSQISSLSSFISDYDFLSSLIEIYWDEKYYDLLIPMYMRLIEINPNDIPSVKKLASIYRKYERYNDAIKLLKDFATGEAEDVELVLDLGENYYRMAKKELEGGHFDRAISALREARSFVSNKPSYPLLLGEIYFKMTDYQKALEAYKESMDIDPNNGQVYYKMGQAYEKTEDYREALKCYSEAVNMDKSKPAYYASLAKTCYKLKYYRRAFVVSSSALDKIDNEDSKVGARLEKVYKLAGSRIWLSFRGNSNLISDNPLESVSSLKEDGFFKNSWTFKTGKGIVSSPVVCDGVVYIGSDYGKVYALKQKNGSLIWDFNTKGEIFATPAIGKGVIYVPSNNGFIHAIELSKGKNLWSFKTDSQMNSSPLVVRDKILYFGSDRGRFYALSCKTGDVKWTYETGGKIMSSPVYCSGSLYFTSFDGSICCLDYETGDEKWVKKFGEITSSPAIFDGFLYAGLMDNKVVCLDSSTGKFYWEFPTGGPVSSSPAVAYNKVFVGSDDNNIYAIDAKKGSKEWQYSTGGMIKSSPVVTSNFLFFGSFDKYVYAIDLTSVKSYKFKTGGKVFASPAVAGEMLFISSEDRNLYAFQL